jgi:hypothetical protein
MGLTTKIVGQAISKGSFINQFLRKKYKRKALRCITRGFSFQLRGAGLPEVDAGFPTHALLRINIPISVPYLSNYTPKPGKFFYKYG